jgi:uncharacterized protein
VITEVAYLLGSRLGPSAEVQLLRDLAAGSFIAEAIPPGDWLRIAELIWKYRDLPLGTIDAAVVACAERYRSKEVATLDRRHFSIVRPTHVDALELLP